MINSERLDRTELKLVCSVNQSRLAPCVCAKQLLASRIWFQWSQQLSELQLRLTSFLKPRKFFFLSTLTSGRLLSACPSSLFLAIALLSYSLQLPALSAQQRARRRRPLSLPTSPFAPVTHFIKGPNTWEQTQQNYFVYHTLTLRCLKQKETNLSPSILTMTDAIPH